MITIKKIEEVMEMEKKATKGPWRDLFGPTQVVSEGIMLDGGTVYDGLICLSCNNDSDYHHEVKDVDAIFIAAFRTVAAEVLEMAKKYQQLMDSLDVNN